MASYCEKNKKRALARALHSWKMADKHDDLSVSGRRQKNQGIIFY